jgi:retron-type reverse transcriptase
MVETTGNRKMQIHTTDKPFNITKKQVYEAYKAVKSNAGSAGVDGQTIEQFDSDLRNNLYKLWNRMSSGSYFPSPVRAVSMPKKTGGQRILGVPTVGQRPDGAWLRRRRPEAHRRRPRPAVSISIDSI